MSCGLSNGRTLNTSGFGLTREDLPTFDPAKPDACRVDPRAWFGDASRRLEIEIGVGKGTFLVQQASLQPEVNFLGIEWAGEFYRYAADRMRRRNLTNVRVLHFDAVEFMRFHCVDEVASVIHLYFLDPWQKKRHHKRRVVQNESLHSMHRILRKGGELRLVTDHDDLWAWYEQHAARHGDLLERCEFTSPVSAAQGELVGTNYERKFAIEGRSIRAMMLRKR